jgi:hypothetical protein
MASYTGFISSEHTQSDIHINIGSVPKGSGATDYFYRCYFCNCCIANCRTYYGTYFWKYDGAFPHCSRTAKILHDHRISGRWNGRGSPQYWQHGSPNLNAVGITYLEIRSSGTVKCTLPLDLTSGSGFSTAQTPYIFILWGTEIFSVTVKSSSTRCVS